MKLIDEKIKKFLDTNLGASSGEMTPIKKGGSDRNFFRISLPGQNSLILMQYGTEIEENTCWAGIAIFLKSIEVSVPSIIAHDPILHFILMEDLGDLDLWSYRQTPWAQRRNYYFQALQLAHKLHSFLLNNLPIHLKLMPGYDAGLYRWEHNYFRENFVEAVCRLNPEVSFQKELNKELDNLIFRLRKIPLCLIHRDLQSQNILIKNDKPVLIDFQGTRQGNFFYDLGSLLSDPYVSFTEEETNELLLYYYQMVKQKYNWDEFKSNFLDATIQRLMQALGAYGYLGLKKNRSDFLQHTKCGIINLANATDQAKNLPILNELVIECRIKLNQDLYEKQN